MRLLVVEDEEAIADFLVRGLGEHGHAVDLAADGITALELASGFPFDVIVLDVMLPKLDGFAVCSRLREAGVRTPIIMLTAKDSIDDRVSGLDSGADDYLVKPFAFSELLARIRALSRREPQYNDVVLRVADLELDTSTKLAQRNLRQIALTSREYALLEYFMLNAGKALTREMITDRIWSFDGGGFTNVIDVYVARLRRKIDAPDEPRLIHTVRGFGYKIEAP